MQPIRTEDDLTELHHQTTTYATLAAWSRLGYLNALSDGPPKSLAELGGNVRALEISARVLAFAGVLLTDGARWTLSPAAKRLHAAGALRLDNIPDWLGDLSRLESVIRDGGPARAADGTSRVTRGGVREDKPEQARAFLMFLHRRSEESAQLTAEWLAPRLPKGAHVLDLGGGHGRYAKTFADHGLRATLFDRPVPVELARELNGDQISYVSGDFTVDDLGGPYDAVFLSNIVHGEPPESNEKLTARVAEKLRPGGLFVVKDMFVDDLYVGPQQGALFGMTMLMYTAGGQSYGRADVDRWCAKAGLSTTEIVQLGSFALLIATKR